jgi:acetyl esterase
MVFSQYMSKALCVALLLAVAAMAATVQSDIEYAKDGDVSLKMDASIPDGAGPFPTVLRAVDQGRLHLVQAPQYRYPAAVDDVVAALRYVEAHAAEYKVDPKRTAIAGESAGGHIVALIGARYGRELHLAAVVPFFPPTDMDALEVGADETPNAVVAV